MSETNGYEIGWDSEIENDGAEFTILPEGDYNFEVVNYERGRHTGSDKLPPCNKAIVYIKATSPSGTATIKHNLFLHSSTEGMLCAFFAGIGQRKRGDKAKMNWGAVVGSRGRCKVGVRKWTGSDGVERTYNDIRKFYEPEETRTAPYEPGRF